MKLILFITIQILSVILLYFNARKIPSTVYLGLFFVLVSLCGFCPFSIFYPETTPWDEVIFLGSGFAVSIVGPILQLYVRSVLTDNLCLSIKDLWHLMPFFFFHQHPFFRFYYRNCYFPDLASPYFGLYTMVVHSAYQLCKARKGNTYFSWSKNYDSLARHFIELIVSGSNHCTFRCIAIFIHK